MPVFRLKPEAWPAKRNRMILRGGIIGGLAAAVGIWIAQRNDDSTLPFWAYGFILLPMAWGIRSGVMVQRKNWDTLELEIDGDEIRRRTGRIPEFVLRRADVRQIVEYPDGLLLKGATSREQISVPADLAGFEQAATLVRGWAPITGGSSGRARLTIALSVVLTLGLFALASSNGGWLGAIAAFVLAAFLIVSLWIMQRHPAIDPRVRRWSWLVLLPIASLLVRTLSFRPGGG